jgi:predicted RNA-binding protein
MKKELTKMTQYWLTITTRENFNVSSYRKFDIDGYKNIYSKKVNQIEPENKFICYIMQECLFGCIYQAITKYAPYNDDKALRGLIWADEKRAGHEIYTLRFRTEPILELENDNMLDARSVVKNLKFVTNKEYWGSHFHTSLREIPKEDFDFIESEMKKLF